MSASLKKGFLAGTHRLVSPEETLERISPHLHDFGITRCADITGLDCIGIPVYVAVRPQGRVLQTANGKGLRHVDAVVSAQMESIEQWHAENPAVPFRRASLAELRRSGAPFVPPRALEGFAGAAHFGATVVLDWVEGEDLLSGQAVWIPAFAGYYYRHQHFVYSFNGLASGNHIIEARLHGLYELIERDTLARLSAAGQVHLEDCDVIEIAALTGTGGPVASLSEMIGRAGLELFLLRAPSPLPTHTFMAVLIDPSPFGHASTVNFGAGAHLSPTVAATRAITEAAQSRLTFIHGSRDDLTEEAYRGGSGHAELMSFFHELPADTSWGSLDDLSTDDLVADYERVLAGLRDLGFEGVYAVDLSRPGIPVSVVKTLIPGARCPRWI
jgi:ribosomal protein S12 methylthiotransferase accessory factor